MCIEAKGIVVEIDCIEFWKVENGGKERREGLGDLAEESAGEDVCKICDLRASASVVATWIDVKSYFEVLFGREDLSKTLASSNAQGVAQNSDFLDVLLEEACDVRFEIGLSGELEALALQGKDSLAVRHLGDGTRWRCFVRTEVEYAQMTG